MARMRVKRPARPKEVDAPATSEGSVPAKERPTEVTRADWTRLLVRLAIGLVAGLAVWFAGDRSEHAQILGILVFFVSIGWAARAAAPAPTAPTDWRAVGGFVIGGVLIASGALTLLTPAIVDAESFREITETASMLPLYGVLLLAAGVGTSLYALHRLPAGEGPFALEKAYRSFGEKVKTELNPRFFFLDTWRELDREASLARTASAGGYDWRPIVVLAFGAVFLSLMEYFGHAPTLREILNHYDPIGRMGPPTNVWGVIRDSPFDRLLEFAWWSGWRVLGFFLLPAAIVKFVLRERVVDHGLQTHGFTSHAWIYLLFFGFVLLLVIGVSYQESFQTYYPFYSEASRSWYDFWAWEMLYAAQFFSLEFFFRGFWLKAAKRAMGSHAIYAMVVPYCMIHFGKPFPETLAAIVAGVVLGTLALRTRSIWSGFLIHVSVAISMDLAALAQTTGLPDRWWPEL